MTRFYNEMFLEFLESEKANFWCTVEVDGQTCKVVLKCWVNLPAKELVLTSGALFGKLCLLVYTS